MRLPGFAASTLAHPAALATPPACAPAVEPERVRESAAARPYDVTGAVIRQLEASLSSSPTQQQAQQTEQQPGQPPAEQQQAAGGEQRQRWWHWR